MAAMANFTLVAGTQASAHGPVKFDTITWTGPSSYNNTGTPTTSGNTGLAAGLGTIRKGQPTPIAVIQQGAHAYGLQYDPVTDLLRVFNVATPFAEVTNATDLSAVTFRAVIISY